MLWYLVAAPIILVLPVCAGRYTCKFRHQQSISQNQSGSFDQSKSLEDDGSRPTPQNCVHTCKDGKDRAERLARVKIEYLYSRLPLNLIS
jgi:Carbon starvation protein, predicted membrane protein